MKNEDPQSSPAGDGAQADADAPAAGRYDQFPQTQDFPAFQPPPPAAGYPGQPQWAVPQGPIVVRLRVRDHVTVALSTVLAVALVFALPAVLGFMWMSDSVSVQLTNDQSSAQQAGDGQPAGGLGADLREGAVYIQTNDAKANEVVAFVRNAEGMLRELGRYPTGGAGSGSVEDVAQSVVLGTADGEASPFQDVEKGELLFVPNAGSGTISVFRVKADGLELASEVPSGGQKPISLTVNRGLLYVLNSGEFDNRLFVDGNVLENCGHGQLPSVTGFRVTTEGGLTQIKGSTRLLSGEHESGCAQVSFSPDGKVLLVTERIAGKHDPATTYGKGAIHTFPVRPDGTLGAIQTTEPTGNGPYAFTFTEDNQVLTVEQTGGSGNLNGGHVASYQLTPDGKLTPIGSSVATTGTDTCWIVLTKDGRYAFTTSPFFEGRISTLTVGKDGSMSLLHPVATAPDGRDVARKGTPDLLLDLALSGDGRFLYTVDGFAGDIIATKVNDNGTLTVIQQVHVVNLPTIEQGWQGGPFGIAAF
jgi:6-phosphogluconolactonase